MTARRAGARLAGRQRRSARHALFLRRDLRSHGTIRAGRGTAERSGVEGEGDRRAPPAPPEASAQRRALHEDGRRRTRDDIDSHVARAHSDGRGRADQTSAVVFRPQGSEVMSIHAAHASISGPSQDRIRFMRRIGLWTFLGLMIAAVIGGVSMFTVAPALFQVSPWAGLIVVLATWVVAHWVARSMVYGSAKLAGFILACVAEGLAFGFLLLTTVVRLGVEGGVELVAQALGLTAMTAAGMLVYVWFSKGQLKIV